METIEQTTGSAELQAVKDEIDAAVNEVVEDIEKSRAAADAKDGKSELPPSGKGGDDKGGEKSSEQQAQTDDGEHSAAAEIPDALVERAVKAGLSIADARAFPKADALERAVSAIEKRSAGGTDASSKAADSTKKEEDETLAALDAIPDLDPDVYDDAVVKGFKLLRDTVRRQHATIKELTAGAGSARQASWFDGQVAALGEDFVGAVGKGDRAKLDPASPQAKNLADLETKFNVLEAGYKAAGQTVEREAVFKEAVALVLGDVKAKAEAGKRSEALSKRSRLHINRPGGANAKPSTDPFEDAAATLDKKYFKK